MLIPYFYEILYTLGTEDAIIPRKCYPYLMPSLISAFFLTMFFFFSFSLLVFLEGKGKKRNPLHDFKKTGELMLIKVNKTLEVKTKLLNTTEQCAKRCSRSKGLSFTCK